MYEANHGEWAIGARAQEERYGLFSFGRTVIQAVEIESLERTTIYSGDPNEKRDDRHTIHGMILEKGHPVFDKYVGKPSPVAPPATRSATSGIRSSTANAASCAYADAARPRPPENSFRATTRRPSMSASPGSALLLSS